MSSVRTFTLAAAALLLATPVAAQQRGTMEFGAFGSAASFDQKLSLDRAFGGGGRIGMYLDPRWAAEFENAEMRATRPNGLRDVNVGILSGRLVLTPVTAGRLSLLLGAGAGVGTETNFLHSYGVDALVGGKLALTQNVALRVDGVYDWLANEKWKSYRSVRVGMSVMRHPRTSTRTEIRQVAGPSSVVYQDSVGATEMRRLRDRDTELRFLRDSLRLAPGSVTPADVATMEARIRFKFNKADLTDSAKRILDEKVTVFRAFPAMSIELVGFADSTGTDAYNMKLGDRRAEAAKKYLVKRGIAKERIITWSRGERQPANTAPNAGAQADNRRAVFRLIIAPE